MVWNIRKQKTTNQNNKKKKNPKNGDSITNLWENKRSNICLVGVPEREEEEQENWKFEKIMKENFPNLVKEIDMQVQEAQRVPNKVAAKRSPPSHMIMKMPKVTDRETLTFSAL